MKQWRPGDPVAQGAFFIAPGDKKTRAAYAQQLHAEHVETLALKVMSQQTLSERRRVLERIPRDLMQDVKRRVNQLWYNKKENTN